jgi:hypothetical protein
MAQPASTGVLGLRTRSTIQAPGVRPIEAEATVVTDAHRARMHVVAARR